jgi:Domain of unknown function (DUF5134)
VVDGWFGMTVATVFVLTTVLCAVSLATHRPRQAPRIAAAEANHVVMGVAMVLMVTPTTAGLVPPVLGATVFGLAGVGWLAALVVARRRGEALGSAIGVDRCTAHPTHLFLLDAAMLVMYLAMAPAAAPSAAMPEVPGMDMPGMAMPAAPPMGLLVLAAMLALYLVAHAVATVVVVVRSGRRVPVEEPAAPVVGTPAAEPGGVAVAAAPAPAVPRAVSVLAHGPVQLIGQAGMSLAMALMLCLL